MPNRNTALLRRIIDCLGDQIAVPEIALKKLEREFESSLLIMAGNVEEVARYGEQLRLAVTDEECGTVLDYIGDQDLAGITIDR